MLGIIFILGFILFLIPVAICIFSIVSFWYIFKKAGKEGWQSLIPIYNNIVLIEIVGLPMWYIALLFLPFVNIYATIRIFIELSYRFNKDTGFGIGLYFLTPVFLGILAFSKDCVYTKSINNLSSFCSKCGNKVENSDKYCTNCGGNIKSKTTCIKCGNQIKKDDKFCMNCGSKI